MYLSRNGRLMPGRYHSGKELSAPFPAQVRKCRDSGLRQGGAPLTGLLRTGSSRLVASDGGLKAIACALRRRILRNENIFVQCLANRPLSVYDPVMSGAPKAACTRAALWHRAGSLPGERDLRGKEPFGRPRKFSKFSKCTCSAQAAHGRRARRNGRPGRGIRPR